MNTDNELIAEFMGMTSFTIEHDRFWHPTEKCSLENWKYHTLDLDHFYPKSWDWLMPVVAKIAEYRIAYPKETSFVCDCKIVVYRHILYREVVEFIKWYNTQKTN